MTAGGSVQDEGRAARALRCHHCRSTDLVLKETRHEHGEWSGLHLTDRGTIAATGDGYFNDGDVQPRLTRIECLTCGHEWHPRRTFEGSVAS